MSLPSPSTLSALLVLSLALSLAALTAIDAAGAATLLLRLVPVLGFAAGMSVLVNLASRASVFDWAVGRIAAATRSAAVAFVGLLTLCIASTVFFSLDTTAIMLTPLAVRLARRFGLPVQALALAVVWIANLASLPLPVSNLTNLLMLGRSNLSTHEYISLAVAPATAAICVAVAAAYLARFALARTNPTTPDTARKDQEHKAPIRALLVLAATMIALLCPIPYWATSTVAAVAMWWAVGKEHHNVKLIALIPAKALSLVALLSTAATIALEVGVADAVNHVFGGGTHAAIALTGALFANTVNNIPAYLALEPATSDPLDAMALLIGVNAGAVITPWASLATLLWADQLRRAGTAVPWKQFVLSGLIVVPTAVVAATYALGLG